MGHWACPLFRSCLGGVGGGLGGVGCWGKGECAVVEGDVEVLAVVGVAAEEGFGEGGLEVALEEAAEGAGAVNGVVAAFGDPVAGGGVEGEVDAAVGEALVDGGEHEVNDGVDLVEAEGVEEDGVVNAVEEFGAEVGAQVGVDGFAGAFLDCGGCGGGVHGGVGEVA